MNQTSFQQWLRDYRWIVLEVIGDLSASTIIANAEDELAQGIYVNKALYERYLEWLATPLESKMIDTDRADDARGINAETRGIYG